MICFCKLLEQFGSACFVNNSEGAGSSSESAWKRKICQVIISTLNDSSGQVREQSVECIVKLYSFIGTPLKEWMNAMSSTSAANAGSSSSNTTVIRPSQLNQIFERFAAASGVPAQQAPVTTTTTVTLQSSATTNPYLYPQLANLATSIIGTATLPTSSSSFPASSLSLSSFATTTKLFGKSDITSSSSNGVVPPSGAFSGSSHVSDQQRSLTCHKLDEFISTHDVKVKTSSSIGSDREIQKELDHLFASCAANESNWKVQFDNLGKLQSLICSVANSSNHAAIVKNVLVPFVNKFRTTLAAQVQ